MGTAPAPPDDLAAKTVKASAYSITASAATLVLGLSRSIIMARLLVPEDFGTVALALTFLELATPVRDFGLDQALIHRTASDETPVDEVLAVHFTLRLILIGAFALLLAISTPVLRLLYPQRTMLVPVLLALTIGEVARAMGATPTTHLRKEMRFKELAMLQVLTSLSMTIAGPTMAWQGWGIWAIVGERVSGVVAATLTVWLIIRPWRIKFKLKPLLVKWYLSYGKFVFVSNMLAPIMEQFDDFWVGTTLGSHSLGLYSKAYEFAQYPRRIVSDPVAQVLFPVFAKAQSDHQRLSRVFFRAASLVARMGFLFTGALVLSASEFIGLFLGSKWRPMALTFQIMVVYTLLYPLLSISGYLAAACGHPEYNARLRAVQAAAFIPGVILASRLWGINGVAVATDLALIIGLAISLWQVRKLVTISMWRLFSAPVSAFLVSAFISWKLSTMANGSDLLQMVLKASIYAVTYTLIILILEWREYPAQLRLLVDLVTKRQVTNV
jgi:O-antigen/teichoic acid export membrane protein